MELTLLLSPQQDTLTSPALLTETAFNDASFKMLLPCLQTNVFTLQVRAISRNPTEITASL